MEIDFSSIQVLKDSYEDEGGVRWGLCSDKCKLMRRFFIFSWDKPENPRFCMEVSPFKLRISMNLSVFEQAWPRLYPLLRFFGQNELIDSYKISDALVRDLSQAEQAERLHESGQITVYLRHIFEWDAPNFVLMVRFMEQVDVTLASIPGSAPINFPESDIRRSRHVSMRFDNTNPFSNFEDSLALAYVAARKVPYQHVPISQERNILFSEICAHLYDWIISELERSKINPIPLLNPDALALRYLKYRWQKVLEHRAMTIKKFNIPIYPFHSQ